MMDSKSYVSLPSQGCEKRFRRDNALSFFLSPSFGARSANKKENRARAEYAQAYSVAPVMATRHTLDGIVAGLIGRPPLIFDLDGLTLETSLTFVLLGCIWYDSLLLSEIDLIALRPGCVRT